MLVNLWKIVALFSCYSSGIIQGLTIRELPRNQHVMEDTTGSAVAAKTYHNSVAKVKEAGTYRVPEHLQFVPKGFVYEDTDDVIHVIDPPKQFEELKKVMQRQQQRQLQNLRPTALRERSPKPKIEKQRISLVEMDLPTQESQHLPIEILASVRKTENYLRKYKPKLPAVRQRLKTHKIQTVILEQQQEQQQFQQGEEQRLQGVKEQTVKLNQHKKKRFKRDTGTLAGNDLLNHLSELIKNASSYLQQAENFDDYPESDIEATTLHGEIMLKTTDTPLADGELSEDMVSKILENSVKATNVIMQQIKSQTNLTTIGEKCDHLKVTYPNHIINLQNQIKCMQNFIRNIKETQEYEQKEQKEQQLQPLEPIEQIAEEFGGRVKSHNRRNHLHQKPFIVAQLTDEYTDDAATATALNSSLIYDDVMTTIRNMLQLQNLESLGDIASRFTSPWQESFSETAFILDMSRETVDFQELHEYLTALEAIVVNLPKFNLKSLNLEETAGSSSSKYYFINPQGTIYSLPQPFQKDATTTAAPTTIFHQFPDLPIVNEYLKNATLFPPSSQLLDIV